MGDAYLAGLSLLAGSFDCGLGLEVGTRWGRPEQMIFWFKNHFGRLPMTLLDITIEPSIHLAPLMRKLLDESQLHHLPVIRLVTDACVQRARRFWWGTDSWIIGV
jgi:hypothetical protein